MAGMSTTENTPQPLTEDSIESLIRQSTIETCKMGQKTTVVMLQMPNGFEIVGSSACADPADYNHELGKTLALNRIRDKIWELEAYRVTCEAPVGE